MEDAATAHYSRYRFVVLALFGLVLTINVLFLLSLGILLPGISEDLGLSPSEQGWLGSAPLLGNLIFALPAGLFLSRFNPRIIIAVLFLMASFILAHAWAPSFPLLLLTRLGFGLASVARLPASVMLFRQWLPPREIVLANGVMNGTYGPSALLALVLTPFLLLWLDGSWRLVLTVFSILAFAIAVAWLFLGRDSRHPMPSQKTSSAGGSPIRSIFKYRQLWYLAFGLFGMNIMWGAFITFWPTLQLNRYGIPLTTSGAIFSLGAVIESAGSVAIGVYLSKRTGRDLRCPLVMALGSILTLGALGMVLTGSVPLLVLFAVVHGIGYSMVPIVFTVPFQLPNIQSREIAVAFAFVEMSLQCGGMVGPVLAGQVQEATGDLRFALLIAASCAASIVVAGFIVFRRRVPRASLAPAPDA